MKQHWQKKELSDKLGHQVERQKPISVFYNGELLEETGFRADSSSWTV